MDLPDLAGRALGGSVLAASDEFFADKENLIRPEPPVFTPHTFTAKGQRYDGWETQRRRGQPGHDWVLLRLGAAGIVRGVLVDTTHFLGNYPERCAVWAANLDGYPEVAEVAAADWVELVPEQPLTGGTGNPFEVDVPQRFSHLRLDIHPDGGVARLRAHGEVVLDPRQVAGAPLDLVACVNGGAVVACSDEFYSAPSNMLQPGLSQSMSDGWETARRRGGGNDWAVLRLAAPAALTVLELDTTHYRGNCPSAAALAGFDSRATPPAGIATALADEHAWFPLLPATRLLPDTPHRFRLSANQPVTHVRLDIFPDGGIGRLRLFGPLTDDGWQALGLRWYNLIPAAQATALLVRGGLPAARAADQVATRPASTLPPIWPKVTTWA